MVLLKVDLEGPIESDDFFFAQLRRSTNRIRGVRSVTDGSLDKVSRGYLDRLHESGRKRLPLRGGNRGRLDWPYRSGGREPQATILPTGRQPLLEKTNLTRPPVLGSPEAINRNRTLHQPAQATPRGRQSLSSERPGRPLSSQASACGARGRFRCRGRRRPPGWVSHSLAMAFQRWKTSKDLLVSTITSPYSSSGRGRESLTFWSQQWAPEMGSGCTAWVRFWCTPPTLLI